jgi:hypothetical protein
MKILAAGIGTVADDGRLDALEIAARAIELLLLAHHPPELFAEQARHGRVRLGCPDARPKGHLLVQRDGDVSERLHDNIFV